MQRLTYRPAQNAVLRSLAQEGGSRRLLDVGCGTGQLAARIERKRLQAEVFGCDFSRGMLRRAAARSAAVRWVQADALALPFGDASFDVVISTEAFHWFPDMPRVLAEFHRILTPDGRLLLAVINPASEPLSRVTAVGSRVLGQPLYWPTRRKLRGWLEEAGFRVESQRAVFRLPASLLLPEVLTQARRDRGATRVSETSA